MKESAVRACQASQKSKGSSSSRSLLSLLLALGSRLRFQNRDLSDQRPVNCRAENIAEFSLQLVSIPVRTSHKRPEERRKGVYVP